MKRVLIAPLDWGLGHATRCIPIIVALEEHKCDVVLAGSGASLKVLQLAFPHLPAIILPGYDPVYPTTGSMASAMVKQLPKFFSAIVREGRALKKIIAQHQIDIVISDNRYGLYNRGVHSIFITHQSNILMPARFGALATVVRRVNRFFMNRFSACWIPDFPGDHSLAGRLISAEHGQLKVPVEFIGSISRFQAKPGVPKTLDVLAIISGPEPQRTVFEKIVAEQLRASSLRYLIVRGLPGNVPSGSLGIGSRGSVENFLNGDELQTAINQSSLIISRSGYSSVMDLAALQAKALFVPTPGQTEQEYLAARLMEKGIALAISQEAFNLQQGLTAAKQYTGFIDFPVGNALLQGAIEKLIH